MRALEDTWELGEEQEGRGYGREDKTGECPYTLTSGGPEFSPVPLLTGCVTLGNAHNLSEPRSPHL